MEFDEDELRGEDCISNPMGVLSLYIKQCRNINTSGFVSDEQPMEANHVVAYDLLFHISVEASPRYNHPNNWITINCFGSSMGETRLIGQHKIHLYELMSKLKSDTPLDLMNKNVFTGLIDADVYFAYGSLGYGYSNQLSNLSRPMHDIVGHSIFPRIKPSRNWTDRTTGILIPHHVERPAFLNFDTPYKKLCPGIYFPDPPASFSDGNIYPTYLMRKIGSHVDNLWKTYKSKEHTRARMRYLRFLLEITTEEDLLHDDLITEEIGGINKWYSKNNLFKPAQSLGSLSSTIMSNYSPKSERDVRSTMGMKMTLTARVTDILKRMYHHLKWLCGANKKGMVRKITATDIPKILVEPVKKDTIRDKRGKIGKVPEKFRSIVKLVHDPPTLMMRSGSQVSQTGSDLTLASPVDKRLSATSETWSRSSRKKTSLQKISKSSEI